MPLEERLKAGVLGLVGGDLPYILSHTTEKGIVRKRDEILERENISLEEAEKVLRETMQYEPLKLAHRVKPERVYIILASNDGVVPTEKGRELWNAMGKPELEVYLGGHRSAVLWLPFIKQNVLDFFRERFGE